MYLFFQLKRFAFDSTSMQWTKINSYFSFPELLDLSSLSIDGSCIYRLQGIIVHQGTISSGHYYSFVQVKPEQWMLFNDTDVRAVSLPALLKHSFGSNVGSPFFWLV